MVEHDEDEHSQDETQSGRNGLRPPWTAMTATGTPWDPAKLFVLWRPRSHLDGYVLTESGPLPAGHPGVVHDSSWQDVGVTWIGFERELFTTGSVFDTQDLEQVSAEVFARAVLGIEAGLWGPNIHIAGAPGSASATFCQPRHGWTSRAQRSMSGRSLVRARQGFADAWWRLRDQFDPR